MKFPIGSLVLYKGKCAAVSALSADKISIRIAGGGEKSVREKDFVFLHSGPAGALPPAELPPPDCGELAGMMGDEKLSFSDFLEIAYGEDSPAAAWSACNLLEKSCYFSGVPGEWVTARPQEEIAAALAAQEEKAARENARRQLLERIKDSKLLESDLSAMREIEQVALGTAASSRLMRDLELEASPEKAHELLLRCGVWDETRNPWPERFGAEMSDNAEELPPFDETEEREDLTWLASYAIDDEYSNDPDDAVAWHDGRLYVHVADPASVIKAGSPADTAALERGSNLYLPEKTVHMLPPAATELFGLGLTETSPAMTFVVDIADDGRAKLEKVMLSQVRVRRESYESAQPLLSGELAPALEALERFRSFRQRNGALFIRLPEVKVLLNEDGRVAVRPVEFSPVREFVANAMLAAGAAAANYAVEHDAAMPFVTQLPPELDSGIAGIAGEESITAMFAARKGCSPGVLSALPKPHSGLGLSAYVRVTSPLRRYEDILSHRQLRRMIKGEELLTFEEIDALLPAAENAASLCGKLERQSNEFWKIVFFRQNPDWQGMAIPVYRQDDRISCLIPELAYEFKTKFGGKLELGEERIVQNVLADPVTMNCRFHFV